MKENNLDDDDDEEKFYHDSYTVKDPVLIQQSLYRLEIHYNILRDGNARTKAAVSLSPLIALSHVDQLLDASTILKGLTRCWWRRGW